MVQYSPSPKSLPGPEGFPLRFFVAHGSVGRGSSPGPREREGCRVFGVSHGAGVLPWRVRMVKRHCGSCPIFIHFDALRIEQKGGLEVDGSRLRETHGDNTHNSWLEWKHQLYVIIC